MRLLAGEGSAGTAKRKRPMFATGEVVGDYEPLYLYWNEAGEKAEEAIIQSRDFQELKKVIEQEKITRLDEALERLATYFLPRVDAEAARRALRKYYGIDIDPSEAAKKIAQMLAGWLIEAAEELGIYKLRKSWERRR
jgi:molecular chaperone GrpE (heat shock protein)